MRKIIRRHFATVRVLALSILLVALPALADAPATVPAALALHPATRESGPEIELQRKLDQPFDLDLQKVELSEAFKQIAATAQISLQVDPACYDDLPYGATTLLSANFRQSKLRDAIETILVSLSLEQSISGASVIIRPSGPLARIGRRADGDELKLLQDLRTSNDLKLGPNGSFDWTTALRAALDNHPKLIVSLAGDTGPLHDKAIDQLKKQLPLSAFRALEFYCRLTNQIWFVEASPTAGGAANPGDGTVRIMPERLWLKQQLERPIQLSFTNAPLEQVVAELSHASGIRFTPEPGLYQAIPLITLNSNNASVMQTLEALSGNTRIAFDVRDDSIFLHLAGANTPPTATPSARPPVIVARIAIPVGSTGVSMDAFIYESDLPPELNELRKQKIRESIEALQRTLTTPPPATTSQPATQPEPK